jgi:Fe-Mn family superoxide dismutase
VNHSIFWSNLAPVKDGGGQPPEGELLADINTKFGSLDAFIEKFNGIAAVVQGSGWGWLGK